MVVPIPGHDLYRERLLDPGCGGLDGFEDGLQRGFNTEPSNAGAKERECD